jgi:hypothetical protein
MIAFVKFAQKHSALVCFYEYVNFGNKMGESYDKMAVFKESHPKYNEYVRISNKIMNDEKLRNTIYSISPLLYNLKPIGAKEWIKYRISEIHKSIRSVLK